MENDIWLVSASNVQKEFLIKFVDKYNWNKFDLGCYLEYSSIKLILMGVVQPDVLEVQIRQEISLELGGCITSKCLISLHGNDIDIFTKNLFYAIIHLKDKILAHCDNNEDVSISLHSFMGYLKTNLVI